MGEQRGDMMGRREGSKRGGNMMGGGIWFIFVMKCLLYLELFVCVGFYEILYLYSLNVLEHVV